MGSGSRIDHQHHLVATTAAGLTIEASTDGVDLMPEEQRGLIDRSEYGLASEVEPTPAMRGLRATPYQDSEHPADLTVQRSAAQQVLDEVADEHRVAHDFVVQARDRWPEPDISYEEDFDAFRRVYEATQDRAIWGQQAVPYLLDDATGGLGAREGGRGFGVELEFDVGPRQFPYEVSQAIARDLYAAGLSVDPHVHDHRAQREAGYTDAANAWRMEADCTVAGEIVSPILYDEPETWQNLATVCEIIQRHGGRASERTGGHVHVGLHDYDHDVANHNRLMRMYGAYEDVLFRLASNPNAPDQEHRGTAWCHPNSVPADGYSSLAGMAAATGRSYALNLSAARGERSDHGEFRLWDGSVDPATIQTQVNLSLGMVAAAARHGASPTHHSTPMRLGSHREQLRQRGLSPGDSLNPDALEPNSLNFRRLVDEIFHRRQDKEQATALFAITRWQHNT